jgi:hypothetical protein
MSISPYVRRVYHRHHWDCRSGDLPGWGAHEGGQGSFNRTVFYTIAALLVALIIWLAVMLVFVGPALKR